MPKLRLFPAEVKAVATLLALFATPAVADETEEPHQPDLVVTANRVPTESDRIGSAVTVITAEEIERSQKRAVADLLREVPGLSVVQTGGAGRTTTVRMRGLPGQYTKVIIDGIDMADPSQAQPQYDFANLLTADIERIEVVRGPQSLLYGGDAAGGVINITTRKGEGAPRLGALVEAGSLHTYTAAANISGSQGRFSYALGATHFQTDGISAAAERNGNHENDPAWNETVNARLGIALTDDWDIEASARHTRAFAATDGWGTVATDDDSNQHTLERSGRLGTTFSLFDGRLRSTLSYTVLETERDLGTGKTKSSYYTGETGTAEYQGTLRLAQDHTLVFGAENRQDSLDQGGWSALHKDVADNAAFADYQFSPLSSLFLTLGGRLDDHETFGRHTTWRGTAAYLVDATATRLHGSIGTGFRAPSLYELYGTTLQNTGLAPEESRGWDLGVEQSFLNGRALLDVTWFDNRFKNMIRYAGSWGTTDHYENVASARTQGVEVGGHWQVGEMVRLNAGYTFTDSRDNGTGQILARQPKHQSSLGATWRPLERLSADATWRLVGRRYDSATARDMGGYGTFDLAASYDIADGAALFGRVENLLDKAYEEAASYGGFGRMVFAGIRASF